MADLAYRNETGGFSRSRANWGAIWAGAFTFMAIWSVFGALGLAIFTNRASTTAGTPAQQTPGYGLGIWVIVLTIVAMYVAGRETAHAAAPANRHEGVLHGMAMFGLSVVGALVIASLGTSALSSGAAVNPGVHGGYLLSATLGLGWIGFVALFLGWLAAIWGATSYAGPKTQAEVRDIRSAA
jgi:hypothetical protein